MAPGARARGPKVSRQAEALPPFAPLRLYPTKHREGSKGAQAPEGAEHHPLGRSGLAWSKAPDSGSGSSGIHRFKSCLLHSIRRHRECSKEAQALQGGASSDVSEGAGAAQPATNHPGGVKGERAQRCSPSATQFAHHSSRIRGSGVIIVASQESTPESITVSLDDANSCLLCRAPA